jgi:hypothetical protein
VINPLGKKLLRANHANGVLSRYDYKLDDECYGNLSGALYMLSTFKDQFDDECLNDNSYCDKRISKVQRS